MLDNEIRQTIIQLHNKGKSRREISIILEISRNTVKKVLLHGATIPQKTMNNRQIEIIPILREVFSRCMGNAVRVHEILKAEYNFDISYSSLTRLIQNEHLRKPIKRVGTYVFAPGEEMQHDTSPHKILLGDKNVTAQCASLVFGYSRKIFIQYFPCFTRFEAKTFLKAGLEFMGGCCKRCVIDNTSVILASGSGPDAIFSPEMLTFSKMYGFEFFAHIIRDPNRKGKVERPFYYIETNFLAGRTFKNWDDLNQQAIQWCLYANQKEKRDLGMTPECAYVQEKPHLIRLPEILPPIYEHYQRIVDSNGFINLDTNKYSAPEHLIGRTLDVYKYPEEVRLFYQRNEIAIHRRLSGKRCEVSSIPEHHIKHVLQKTQKIINNIESVLRSYHEILDLYITDLKKHVRGRGMRAINKLLDLKHTYPQDAFIQAVKQAHKYGLYDLNRLEELTIKLVAGNYFNLQEEEL